MSTFDPPVRAAPGNPVDPRAAGFSSAALAAVTTVAIGFCLGNEPYTRIARSTNDNRQGATT